MKPDGARVLQEGFVAGFIGYGVVVVFFAVLNLIQGNSVFFTAEALGRPLVAGAEGPLSEGSAGAVFAYNGVHLAAFLLIGIAAAWVTLQTEKYPLFWYFTLYLGLAGFFLSTAYILVMSMDLPGFFWLFALIANLAAGAAMGFYLVKAHPRLWSRIKSAGEPAE